MFTLQHTSFIMKKRFSELSKDLVRTGSGEGERKANSERLGAEERH